MTTKIFRLALVGTDSLRGKEVKEALDRKNFPLRSIDFYDPDVEGEYSKLTRFRGEPKVIHNLEENSLDGIDLVFFASSPEVNQKFVSLAGRLKFRAIDLSEAFNDRDDVPLIVSGVNDSLLDEIHPALIANPHPAAITLSHLFHPLRLKYGRLKAVCFILEPASAYDESGIDELASQSVAMLNSASLPKKIFKDQIAFNFLRQNESSGCDGLQVQEKQIISEVRRVLGDHGFGLTLAVVQAPVFHTYSIMTFVELEKEAGIKDLKSLFSRSFYFNYILPSKDHPVSSVAAAGEEKIFIGPIKKGESFPNSFWIWTVSDNLTCGSALNALEIAEKIISSSTET